jgi:anti-sigma B factor antagonist
MSDLKIRKTFIQNIVVLTVQSPVMDVTNCRDHLLKTVEAEINAGHRKIVIDLDAVVLIDSTGLSQVMASFKYAKQHDGKVKYAAVKNQVWGLFKLLRFNTVLETFESVQLAINSF